MEKSEISILLVEDDTFYAELITDYLDEKGFVDIRFAKTGVECFLQVFEERIPEIVIMDYKLLQLDGLAVMKKLLLYQPNMQVIIISNQMDINVAITAMKLGAKDYLVKNDRMFEKLAKLLNQYTPPKKVKRIGGKLRSILDQTIEFYNDAFLGNSKS